MRIEVHIKDKQFNINCGDGLQRIRWLGDVAIFRHSHFYGQIISTTKGVRFENGQLLDINAIISDTLTDGTHVWIILKEDLEALGLEGHKKQNVVSAQNRQNSANIKRPSTAYNLKKQ